MIVLMSSRSYDVSRVGGENGIPLETTNIVLQPGREKGRFKRGQHNLRVRLER